MSQATLNSMICSLCSMSVPNNPIFEEKLCFCCHGCHSVYKILESKNGLEGYEESSVFKQAVQFGLISNPNLLADIRKKKEKSSPGEFKKLHFEISDMWCPSCAEVIKLIMLQKKGVLNCVVDYSTDLASVEFNPMVLSEEDVFSFLRNLGYHPQALNEEENKEVSRDLYFRFGVALFCALNIMMFSYPIYLHHITGDLTEDAFNFAWLSALASLPVLGFSAVPIFKRFINTIKVGFWGMETLVVLGVSTAFTLSIYELLWGHGHVYFDSMAMIIVFVLLGKIIESKAKFSARRSLIQLTRALPRRGKKRFSDGSARYVPVKEFHKGDHLLVVTGEKVVLDGNVIEGSGYCDESLMTGESLPVKKEIGAPILGGTILKQGCLVVEVGASIEDSALKKIIDMIGQDLANKSTYYRPVDAIVKAFVPIIIVLSILTCLGTYFFLSPEGEKTVLETALLRGISVLLISCPCAIGIAAPLAESLLMNTLASLGVIIRNRGVLPLLGKESIFVFDKTGTVTKGYFTVLEGLEELTPQLRARIKGVAEQSRHPISQAIAHAIHEKALSTSAVVEHAGKGIEGNSILLGSFSFLNDKGIVISALENGSNASEAYVAFNGKHVATIFLGDEIRPSIKSVLKGLQGLKTFLLSGDTKGTVASVAKICGFTQWEGECSPLHKKEVIENLKEQGHIIAMVGDGINDAPALTTAHIGISVVNASDISIQVSDILLTTDNLNLLPQIRQKALHGQKIIKQNLFWAFFYNIIGVALAMGGYLAPIYAAFAMISSSLIVLFNALRLKRASP